MEGRKVTSAGLMASALVVAAILLAGSVVEAAATSYVVGGGSSQWTFQTSNLTFYSDWASAQKFAAGDKLVFNYTTGSHDVVEVPKSGYDSCSTTNSISTIATGPATVTLTSGSHYYICGFQGHCSAGMKLAVTVAASASPSVPATPPSASSPAPSAPKVAAPKASSPAPKVAAPKASSPAPTTSALSPSPPKATTPKASSPAPTTSATPPRGAAPTVPSTTAANPPTAPGPSGTGNTPSSSPALRIAATAVVILAVATASLVF